MALLENFVKETSTTTGTGNFTLSSSTGFRQFSAAFSTGGTDRFFYSIRHTSADEWEFGTGHLSDSTTLVRDTVIDSSNSGSAVNFSSGDKDVLVDAPSSEQSLLPKGYIDPEGLTIANNGTDGDHDLDVTGGFLWVHDPADRTSGNLIEVPDETGALQIDTTGEGGRINSSTHDADAWYEGSVLYNPDADTVGFGMYKDGDRPTAEGDLPGSFTQFRAMGSPGKSWWVLTDGSSNIVPFLNASNGWVSWDDSAIVNTFSKILDTTSPANSSTSVDLSSQMPPVTCDVVFSEVRSVDSSGGSLGISREPITDWFYGQITTRNNLDNSNRGVGRSQYISNVDNQEVFYDSSGAARVLIRGIASWRAA